MKHILTLFTCCCLCGSLYAQVNTELLQQFRAETGATINLHESTESPNFVRLPQGRALRFSGTLTERTNAFLTTYGGIFGMTDPAEELSLKDIKRDELGFRRYTLEQRYQGIPVFDGQLHFHFDQNQDISAINGNFLPNIDIDSNPALNATTAGILAVEAVLAQNRGVVNAPLFVKKNTLYVFNAGLPKGTYTKTHLVYEVEVRNDLDVREFIFIDAHKGDIIEQYTGIACALFRRLYVNNSGNQVWQEGDAFPAALDQGQQNQLAAAEHTYNFFKNAFNYISYDNADAEMLSIDKNGALFCPNANWNGTTVNFCANTASDDIVAHEWGHAYTEYTNDLIYSYEAGAINESLSDIWGETIDLYNGYEDAGEDNSIRSGTGCSESNRWKIGEDATAFAANPLRDMWVPGCNTHPDIVGGTHYHCAPNDNGGVHINSGIPNRVYSLLVDGGTFNGQTITAINFVKAAHIFWRAQTVYLTKTSDFAVLADALEQACQDLMNAGTDLEGISTSTTAAGLSGEVISAADCVELSEAILAVNLRGDNGCNFSPLLSPAPQVCGTGTPANVLFSEDWESGLGAWTLTQIPTNPGTWTPRDWVLDSSLPDGRLGTGVFGANPTIGECNIDLNNGLIQLQSPVININSMATGPVLMTFEHYVALESGWDGGQVHYKLNSGSWTRLPGTAFTTNGYNSTLQPVSSSSDNPYAGQEAFSGADAGSVSGTWGQSQVDLSMIGATPGDNLELRWDVATDGCRGWDGWYLDEIVIYSCTPAAAANVYFTNPSSSASEDQANVPSDCLDYYETTVRVEIGVAPTQPVDVIMNATGTATIGTSGDYTFTPLSFTLDAGNLFQDIVVRIYDDAIIEGGETAVFDYILNPNGGNGGAAATNQTHTLTINDDDLAPNNASGITVLSDNFDFGIAAWTITDGGNTAATWQGVVNHFGMNTLDGTPFLFANSDASGPGSVLYEVVESPIMNTQGMTNLMINFDQYFLEWAGAGDYDEVCSIEVWDGAAWQNVFTQTEADGTMGAWGTPASASVNIPDVHANANMKIRFIYDSGHDYWWAVDNLTITGDQVTAVQSPVNTTMGDEQYLGPNAEVYFYDPMTGHIMARIKNLSAHDYGCTIVEVERAGIAASQAWAAGTADYIADKTFQVTPTNNNPTGNYEISLYYTEAEIAGWETATGRLRVDLAHIRTPNDLPTPTAADTRTYEVATTATYGADWTYTATYTTGFSDFGIGPIEPSVRVAPKVLLQGPYDTGTALMKDDLRNAGLLPTTEPYTALGYTHINGGGGESVAASRLASSGSAAILDWVVVELRDDITPSTILASRSALLLANGNVVDTDGVSPVRFSGITAGNYYVAIRHRNHLSVMTDTAVALN